MMERQSWETYFLAIAEKVSERSTCPRARVGAVLVRDRNILSTGYNGSPRGLAHCDEAGCDMEGGHCRRVVHAEANAVAQAAKNGVAVNGATLYCTHTPCWECVKLVLNAGVTRVAFSSLYRMDPRVREALKTVGVPCDAAGDAVREMFDERG